jgi:hypothetical protein
VLKSNNYEVLYCVVLSIVVILSLTSVKTLFSAPGSQTLSTCVLSLGWQSKFHTHIKQVNSLFYHIQHLILPKLRILVIQILITLYCTYDSPYQVIEPRNLYFLCIRYRLGKQTEWALYNYLLFWICEHVLRLFSYEQKPVSTRSSVRREYLALNVVIYVLALLYSSHVAVHLRIFLTVGWSQTGFSGYERTHLCLWKVEHRWERKPREYRHPLVSFRGWRKNESWNDKKPVRSWSLLRGLCPKFRLNEMWKRRRIVRKVRAEALFRLLGLHSSCV